MDDKFPSAISARKERADARRAMVMALTEQLCAVLRDSGASEEEGMAALDCAKIVVPLQDLESSKAPRYIG